MQDYVNSQYLRSTDWLAAHLDDVRVVDATLSLVPDPESTYRVVSCRPVFDDGHIPGAVYVDLQEELSRQNTGLRFSWPTEEIVGRWLGRHGISQGTSVVAYSTAAYIWATRLWYLLRAFGLEDVAVLDGGFDKWRREERPVSTEVVPEADGETRVVNQSSTKVADKETVSRAIDVDEICILNSLSREQHGGGGRSYGRPGRIRGSKVVPAAELIDPDTGLMREAGELESLFRASGALKAERIITYCGGGIAATGTAFGLALLGYEDRVALYDGSLGEWVQDPEAPMETDEDPGERA